MRNASRMARYMMMRAGREGGENNRANQRGNNGGQNNYGGYNEMRNEGGNSRNEMRGGYGEMRNEMRNEGGGNMEMGYEMENRFRDRRGREHYDNGRFAPMRNEGNMEMEMRRGGNRGGNRGGSRNEYAAESYGGMENRGEMRGGREGGGRSEMRGGNYRMGYDDDEEESRMQMIGFGNREESRSAYIPERMHGEEDEMSHKSSKPIHGGAMSEEEEFTPEIAKEWVKKMHNEDGTMGEHWNMEQVKKLMTQRGIQHNPAEVYAIMNALYSDYCKVLKKYGMNSPELYLDLTMAFLNDKDAKPGKAYNYYEYIAK